VRVVNSALYTSNFTAPTGKLTAVTNTKLLTCQSNRFVDNSADGLTMTPSGNTAVTAFGPFLTSAVYDAAVNGASAYFDGTADALSIAASPISASGNFTLEGWVYSNSAAEQAIVGQYQGRSTGRMIITTGSGLLIFFQKGVTGGNNGSNVALGQWAHFVVQRTGSNIAFYVNGSRVLNSSAGNIAQDYLVIGAEDVNSGNYPNTFDGYISNIRITSSAVYSEGTSITVPTAPYTTVTNTNFLLNMGDGQAIDIAAQNNLTLAGNANTSTDQAKFGNTSLHLDGTGDYAEVASGIGAWGTGNFTVEGWYYLTAQAQYDNLFDFRTSGNTSHLDIYFDDDPLRLHVFFGGADRINANAATPTNEWVHIAVVRNGSTTTLYQNGTSLGTSTTVTTFTDGALRIGNRYSGDYYMQGYVDDFRVSHMARYTSNFTASAEAFPDKGR
jgi:hypothetical protein